MRKQKYSLFIINYSLLISLLFVSQSVTLSAQENKIACLAQIKPDSIVIRWAPASPSVWQMGTKYGYNVTRYLLVSNGQFIPDGLQRGTQLNTNPIMPYSFEQFDKLAAIDEKAAILQDAIYGEGKIDNPGADFLSFMKNYSDLEIRLGYSLLICDMSAPIAKAAGLRICDKNVKPGERYAYRISLVKTAKDMQVEDGVIVCDADDYSKLPAIQNVEAVFSEKNVYFRWNIELYKGIYTAYMIERSTNGKSFTPISEFPITNLRTGTNNDLFEFMDSLPSDKLTYYRVRGLSPFGEAGPVSKEMKGQSVPLLDEFPVIDTAVIIDKGKVKINWHWNGKKDKLKINSLALLRSTEFQGPYTEVCKFKGIPERVEMIDPKPLAGNYYKIKLVAANGQEATSFARYVITLDSIAPAAPAMPSGAIDSAGIVRLVWKANSEPDLLGYRVYKANAPTEEFTEVTHDVIKTPQFTDTTTLNTLTPKIYYKVLASDCRYNLSYFSPAIAVTRPDTVKPSPAAISRILVENTKLKIFCKPSASSDVKQYTLIALVGTDTTLIDSAKWSTTEFLHKAANGLQLNLPQTLFGKRAEFLLCTTDEAGNTATYSAGAFVPAPLSNISLKAERAKSGKSMKLTWELPYKVDVAMVYIYRKEGDKPFCLYNTLAQSTFFYEDNALNIDAKYTYKLRVLTNSGEVFLAEIKN